MFHWNEQQMSTNALARLENHFIDPTNPMLNQLGTCGANEPKNLGPKKSKKWFLMVDVEWMNGAIVAKQRESHYPILSQILRLPDWPIWADFGFLRGNWPQFSDDFGWLSAKVLSLLKLETARAEVSQATATSWWIGIQPTDWEFLLGIIRIGCLDIGYLDWLLYVAICCYMVLYCCCWSDDEYFQKNMVEIERCVRIPSPCPSNNHMNPSLESSAEKLHCPWKRCPTMERDPTRNTMKQPEIHHQPRVKFNEIQYHSWSKSSRNIQKNTH